MPISWNEIRHNAIKFSREWAGVKSESAEKQSFWNEFFQVFGIKRRVVASFEEAVKKISGDYGRIDLFWPGILLVDAAHIIPVEHERGTDEIKNGLSLCAL